MGQHSKMQTLSSSGGLQAAARWGQRSGGSWDIRGSEDVLGVSSVLRILVIVRGGRTRGEEFSVFS